MCLLIQCKALINNPIALVELEEVIFSDTLLSDMIDIKMGYKNGSDIPKQSYFDYQIEFGTSYLDTAVNSIDNCSNLPVDDTPLPFRITNITTEKQVSLWHSDSSIYSGQLVFGEVYGGWCNPVCGRQVEILYDGIQYQGNYTISWDASNYSSGVYFIKMNVGDSQSPISQSQKVVLLK